MRKTADDYNDTDKKRIKEIRRQVEKDIKLLKKFSIIDGGIKSK